MKYSSILLVLFLGACNSAAPKKQLAAPYFNLKGYIDTEVKRLRVLNPEIDKTVEVNKAEEQKKLKIADWQKELSAFSDADINKSAWQGLFKLNKTENLDTYTSDNEKVPVKSLKVIYKDGKVKGIKILISNANSLYTSNDTLSYFPDSLYEIRKTQHIKLLNEKNYRIIGKLK